MNLFLIFWGLFIYANAAIIYVKGKPNVKILLDDKNAGITTSDVNGLIIKNITAGEHVIKAIEPESEIRTNVVFVNQNQKIILSLDSFIAEKKIVNVTDLNKENSMIFVQGGSFKMGSNRNKKLFTHPVHIVEVNDFLYQ